MDYTPINYRKWDFSGRGRNIKKILFPICMNNIWDAIPFHEDIKDYPDRETMPAQDARGDSGHGEVVTYFSSVLCSILGGNPNIIVPAAMFHDTGYTAGAEEFRAAVSAGTDKILRLEHQIRGAHYARKGLIGRGLVPAHISEIQDIIMDHDTRFLSTTGNGKIMQDADILWRFTLPQTIHYWEFIKQEYRTILKCMEDKEIATPNRFHFPQAEQIAKLEMVNTLFCLQPDILRTIAIPEGLVPSEEDLGKYSLQDSATKQHIEEKYTEELRAVKDIYR